MTDLTPSIPSVPNSVSQSSVVARPKLHRPTFIREVIETLLLVAFVYTFVNLATVRFYIEGPSMEPTFYRQQYLIVSRVHYLLGNPQRGEIVVFDNPHDDANSDNPLLIKRLIGLPGETIEIRDQQVYIDGVLLNEPYINEPCGQYQCRDNSWTLGENEYFFMGDNRNHSNDSRNFGPIPRDRIVGEAIVRYWPLSDVGLVTHHRFPEQ